VRIITLYGRSREWAVVLFGLMLLTAASWWIAEWFARSSGFWDATSRVPVTAVAPLLAATLIGSAMDSPDVDLDKASPVRWPLIRGGQVVAWTALAALTLGLVATTAPFTFGSAALVRNVIGYVGIACLATVLLGARLAWVPGIVIGLTLYFSAPDVPTQPDHWWAWSMQDGRRDGSWVVAGSLFLAGLTLYAGRDPKRGDLG